MPIAWLSLIFICTICLFQSRCSSIKTPRYFTEGVGNLLRVISKSMAIAHTVLGVSPPPRKSPPYAPPPTFLKPQVFPQSQFSSIPQNSGGWKKLYTKIPLSDGEQKHVDTYIWL